MASQHSTLLLSPSPHLFPPPLHIRKKSRRATFYQHPLRRSSHRPRNDCTWGPLDDIIDEITGDIWASPTQWSLEASFRHCDQPTEGLHDWINPLKAPSVCAISTVTPLAVSPKPSGKSLMIRKNRSRGSNTSESSVSHSAMGYLRNNKAVDSSEPSKIGETAQQADVAGDAKPASRMRLISNGLSRLLRPSSESKDKERVRDNKVKEDGFDPTGEIDEMPSDDDIEAYLRKHAHAFENVRSLIQEVAYLPAPVENRYEPSTGQAGPVPDVLPSTTKAMLNVFPEMTYLRSDKDQVMWVGLEVEGMLHNRRERPISSVDIVLVVDNGYYVNRDCFMSSLQMAKSALHHLKRGDRVSLWTTHCVHNSVASTTPDKIIPLRLFGDDTEDTFGRCVDDVAAQGTQAWYPARPTPPLADVISVIAQKCEIESGKHDRRHIILLSSVFGFLHPVSETYPHLCVHQINPAPLPFIPNQKELHDICYETCCKNVFASNWTDYQAVAGQISKIILQARSESPVGNIRKAWIEVEVQTGCELLEVEGADRYIKSATRGTIEIGALRLGQARCIFLRIRVSPALARELRETPKSPLFEHERGLDRQHQIRAVEESEAVAKHLLTVKVFEQNTLNPPNSWNFSETPVTIITKLGKWAPPADVSMELYKRRAFAMLAKGNYEFAELQLDTLDGMAHTETYEYMAYLEELRAVVRWYQDVVKYEEQDRKKLPLCVGPLEIATSENHDRINAILSQRPNRRRGMAHMQDLGMANMRNLRGVPHLQDVPNMRRRRGVLDLNGPQGVPDLHRFQLAQILYRSQGT